VSDTLAVNVGEKGRVVVPSSIRARHGWEVGSTLVAIDTELGVLLADRSALESLVRSRLAGRDLVGELLADRRRESALDDGSAL